MVSKTVGVLAMIFLAGQGPFATAQPSQQDWPCWRGPNRNNHAVGPAPIRWSSGVGIAWKTPTPGRGHASPCVSGSQIFLASAVEVPPAQFLAAFDRETGKQLWRTDLHTSPLPKIHENNSHASATPACDGNQVYALFATADSLWASAVDIEGRLVWQRKIGAYHHANGLGASPALFQDSLIICSDNQAEPSVVALNCEDGAELWRVPRQPSDNSATPVLAHVAGRDQILVNGAYSVSSYDPRTGKLLWEVKHGTEVAASTMAFDEKNVYASGNVPEPLRIAVAANGSEDVTDTHVLWKSGKSINYVPSSLLVESSLFSVTDSGVAYYRDAGTGDEHWKSRLDGTFYASPILASNRIYALNAAGTMYVLSAEPEFKLIAQNELGETCFATPAICDGRIYVRTSENLLCITDD